jgi:hypothetical protein
MLLVGTRPAAKALRALALLAAAVAADGAHAYCFSVFDGAGRLVYQSVDPPFDLSRPYSESLARTYSPRHHLIVADTFCAIAGATSVDLRAARSARPAGASSVVDAPVFANATPMLPSDITPLPASTDTPPPVRRGGR